MVVHPMSPMYNTLIQFDPHNVGHEPRPKAAAVRDALLARDILVGTSADPHMLRLLPPLILSLENVQRLAKALEDLTDAPL